MRVFFFSRRFLFVLLLLGVFIILLLAAYQRLTEVRAAPAAAEAPFYQGTSGDKAVALTVNVDWGEDIIPAMLEVFKAQDIKVTFFPTGKWAQQHPELVKSMQAAGHSIQSHGYKHDHYDQLSTEAIVEQMQQAEQIITGITGQRPRYFASPYGEHAAQVVKAAEQQGYRFIMWSLDTIDWQHPAPETITRRIADKAHNDAIILMHPVAETLEALPTMIKELKAQGYAFYTIQQLLPAEKGEDTVAGESEPAAKLEATELE